MGSLLRSFSSSSSSASSGSKKQGDGRSDGDGSESAGSEVYLNVYDLTPMNNYAYWFGIGIFHSGIEVHGMEYGFGAHEFPTSGVFEVEPKSCPGFIFRRSVWLGITNMSNLGFRDFIGHLSSKYVGNSYHLIAKNCNHFTNDVCMHLTGKPIPGWVNRLARLGSFCNCLLPESIQVTAVRLPDETASSDGAVSVVASETEESDEEDVDQYLLTTPGSDITLPRAKHVTITREFSSASALITLVSGGTN